MKRSFPSKLSLPLVVCRTFQDSRGSWPRTPTIGMSPCTPRMMTAPNPTILGFVDVLAGLLTDDRWVTVALVTGTIRLPCTWLKVQQLFCRSAEVSVTASCGKKDLCSLVTTWRSHKDVTLIQNISVCRRVTAHVIAADVRCCFRWVPSERNPADKPSRKSIHKRVRPHRHPADEANQVPVFAVKPQARQKHRKTPNAKGSSCRFAARSSASCGKPLILAHDGSRAFQLVTLPDWNGPFWETRMADYVGLAALRGKPQPDAIRTVAAVMWVSPNLGAPLSRVFPECARQLQGWRRVPRGKSQAPVPYVVAAGAA